MFTPGPAYALYRLTIAFATYLWTHLRAQSQRLKERRPELWGLVVVAVVVIWLVLAVIGIDTRPVRELATTLASILAILEVLLQRDSKEE